MSILSILHIDCEYYDIDVYSNYKLILNESKLNSHCIFHFVAVEALLSFNRYFIINRITSHNEYLAMGTVKLKFSN